MIVLLLILISGLTSLFFWAVFFLLTAEFWLDLFWAFKATFVIVLWGVFMFLQAYVLNRVMQKKWRISPALRKGSCPVLFLVISTLEGVFGFLMLFAATASGERVWFWYAAISFVIYFVISVLLLNRNYKKMQNFRVSPQTDCNNRLTGRHY